MTRVVPYIAEDAIERDAASLIREFENARGVRVAPPIPIEDVAEKHLGLTMEFDDMHQRHGVPRPSTGQTEILGAIYSDGSICIDQSLDPDENRSMEGRFRFTLAHEAGGHWRLHRHIIAKDAVQRLNPRTAGRPSFICRTSETKARVEWQADFYASCLLMPRRMIFDAWDEFFPDRRQRILQPQTSLTHNFVEIPRVRGTISGIPFLESENVALEHFCKPLAERFLVSPIAMRIRLERLGLVHRELPQQRLSANG